MRQRAPTDEEAEYNKVVSEATGTLFVTWKSELWKKVLWATRTRGIEAFDRFCFLCLFSDPKREKSASSDCGSYCQIHVMGIVRIYDWGIRQRSIRRRWPYCTWEVLPHERSVSSPTASMA
jgi:hypothetical protein